MINTIAALQGLYVALGGDIGDVANINTIPDMLEAVASVAGGAGGALPAVTSEDNGDILGVVEGAWAKRDPELPAVNGDDNGKILGVNNGAWGTVAAPLPTVAAADIGDVLTVVSDGESGAQWGKGAIPTPEQNTIIFEGTVSGSTLTFNNGKTGADIVTEITNNKNVIVVDKTKGRRFIYQNNYTFASSMQMYCFYCIGYETETAVTNKILTIWSIDVTNASITSATIAAKTITLT